MIRRTAIFWFRVRRKLGLKIRQRSLSIYERLDRRFFSVALGDEDPAQVLLRFASLAPSLNNDSGTVNREEAQAILRAADLACDHVFDLLGSGATPLGDDIDWHVDFKSGYRWELVHHAAIGWGNLPAGVDIKVPWELSRCLHFASLGLADRVSGDGRYYEEFKRQVRDWIEANPYDRGVNWACAMDVGIRAVNWLNGIMLFERRLKEDRDVGFGREILESLWLHGLHLRRNLEWRGPHVGQLGNHFVANITGLLGIGCLFRSTRAGQKHWEFASEWLEKEIDRQVLDDGCNYETSTSYHRLVFEMFQWCAGLARRCGTPFSAIYESKLEKMSVFVEAYSSPSGVAAQFGDNDSGRLLAVGIEDGSDHRYLAEGDCGFGGEVNRMLLFGGAELRNTSSDKESGFPEGGFWFLSNERGWLGFRAGVVSHGGAHAHCDQLSFVLSVDKSDFIVDRGTGVYSPDVDKRNHYRSSIAHNVLRVNDWEMNSHGEEKYDIFRLSDDTRTTLYHFSSSGSDQSVSARHHGYHRFRDAMTCERRIRLDESHVLITDQIEKLEEGDQLEWYFHFAPDVDVCEEDGLVVAKKARSIIELRYDSRLAASVEAVAHSPAYGVEQAARTLCLKTTFQLGEAAKYTTKVLW